MTECENHIGEMFGEDRLVASLEDAFDHTLEAMISRVEQDIVNWSGADVFEDDVTYLVLEWQP